MRPPEQEEKKGEKVQIEGRGEAGDKEKERGFNCSLGGSGKRRGGKGRRLRCCCDLRGRRGGIGPTTSTNTVIEAKFYYFVTQPITACLKKVL